MKEIWQILGATSAFLLFILYTYASFKVTEATNLNQENRIEKLEAESKEYSLILYKLEQIEQKLNSQIQNSKTQKND